MTKERNYLVKFKSMILMLNVKRNLHIHSKQVLYMKVSGMEVSEMAMVFKNGQMVLNTKVIGSLIKPTEKENLLTLMEIHTKEIGETTKPTGRVFISMLLGHPTMESGKMTYKTDKVKKAGWMVLCTWEATNWERSTDMALILGVTNQSM